MPKSCIGLECGDVLTVCMHVVCADIAFIYARPVIRVLEWCSSVTSRRKPIRQPTSRAQLTLTRLVGEVGAVTLVALVMMMLITRGLESLPIIAALLVRC